MLRSNASRARAPRYFARTLQSPHELLFRLVELRRQQRRRCATPRRSTDHQRPHPSSGNLARRATTAPPPRKKPKRDAVSLSLSRTYQGLVTRVGASSRQRRHSDRYGFGPWASPAGSAATITTTSLTLPCGRLITSIPAVAAVAHDFGGPSMPTRCRSTGPGMPPPCNLACRYGCVGLYSRHDPLQLSRPPHEPAGVVSSSLILFRHALYIAGVTLLH